MKNRIDNLVNALRPFAEIADMVQVTNKRDGERVHEQRMPDGSFYTLYRKDFRAAKEAYDQFHDVADGNDEPEYCYPYSKRLAFGFDFLKTEGDDKLSDEAAKAEPELTGDALTIAFLKTNLAKLRTGGMMTVAMTNPNVMSYMEHWEGRAEKAEAEVKILKECIRFILDADRDDIVADGGVTVFDAWSQHAMTLLKGAPSITSETAQVSIPKSYSPQPNGYLENEDHPDDGPDRRGMGDW